MREQYADRSSLDARSGIYAWQEPRHDLVAEVLARVPVDIDDGVVVDVGCGRGQYLAALTDAGHRAIGIDLSPGLAATAGLAAGAPTLVGDAAALPLPDGCATAALALHVLYHLADPADALRELRRITRPGGTVVVLTNGLAHLAGYRSLLAEAGGVAGALDWPGRHFALEHHELVASALGPVEVVEWTGVIRLDHVEPLVRYAASARQFYEDQCPRPWDEVLARFAILADERLAHNGAIELATSSGCFITRR